MTAAILHTYISKNPERKASLGTIYRHIKVLLDVGIVEAVKQESTDGAPANYYSIVDTHWVAASDAVTHATVLPLISMLSSVVSSHFLRHAEREERPLTVHRMAILGATVNLYDDGYKAFKDAIYAAMSQTGPTPEPSATSQYIALFTCPDIIAKKLLSATESTTHD